ncbi:MAG: septum site-determining protein MinC [Lachnospiraceae bacterium]|nr:septum site-determining protein MinC [Lachnospiraceae bacterium]
MKNTVVIKSFQNGITVFLDEELPFEELLEEVAFKFRESRHFFKDAKMALSLEGRKLTEEEEMQLIDTICENSDMYILCLVNRDQSANQSFLRAIQEMPYPAKQEENEGHFYKGTLQNGEILETESSIVVLGDIHPGSAIISARDIVILGGLFGKAYAGGNGNEKHFIVALEMSPERLQIGDFKYNNSKTKKWPIKPKVQPKIAYVEDGKVVIASMTKESLSNLSHSLGDGINVSLEDRI